jgi:hypothetical protein
VRAGFHSNLAAGDHIFTMSLPANQRFVWTATPGIHRLAVNGGFFSVRFTTPGGGNTGSSAGWVRASGNSLDGFVDVTTNQFITFQGDTAASFHLQISNNGAAGAPQLTALQVNPIDLIGGASANGVVTISQPAPAGGAVVELESDDPTVVLVPDTVTIPPGLTSVELPVTTFPVTGLNAIGITAAFGGILRSVVMSIHEQPAGDRVTITQAEYRASRRQLRVQATSSNASATLQVFVTSTNALIGTLTNNGGDQFRGEFNNVAANPQNITVRSSAGGSASANVVVR